MREFIHLLQRLLLKELSCEQQNKNKKNKKNKRKKEK